MNLRRFFRAALLATVLTTSACGGGTDPDPVTPTPDAGPSDNGNPDPTPTATDTDGDGLPNAVEDKDADGKVDPGETDPNNRDSDCDGLIDGPSTVSFKGEDQNANGAVDAGETDPLKLDTDGDGLTDGVERGVTTNLEPTKCPSFTADKDPTTTTNPANPDSDGDGMQDGAEDGNQDGKVDPGELNPTQGGDASPLVAQVCSTANLKPVTVKKLDAPDLTLGLPSTFTDSELKDMVVSATTRGVIGYDPDSKVAFIAYKRGQVGSATTPEKDEEGLRTAIGAGAPSTKQNFTTWDGTAAMQAFYQGGSGDLTAYVNSLANTLVGSGAGALTGTAGVTGPFKLQAEFVHRSNNSVIVVLAISSAARFDNAGLPTKLVMEDVAGGTGLAQYVDTNSVQCEPFVTGRGKVDFLFVVDDSGSMASSQSFLAQAATDVAAKLAGSSLDWRIGMVTSSYMVSTEPNYQELRGFTNNIDQFKAWLTPNSYCAPSTNQCVVLGAVNSTSCTSNSQCSGGALCDTGKGKCAPISSTLANTTCSSNKQCWVNIDGAGTERSLEAAKLGLNFAYSAAAPAEKQARPDAIPVVVLLTDTRDQSTAAVSDYLTYFQTGNPANQSIAVHGIICPPDGPACDASEDNATDPRHTEIISGTSGVQGSIRDATNITLTINGIVDSTIAAAGYKLAKPPIGASVRVGLESVLDPVACPSNTDLPRSRVNGFDVNGVKKTLSFYGACRPASSGQGNAAVSYRYWVDGNSDPDGKAPCFEDPKYSPTEPDHCEGNFACSAQNACVCVQPTTACPAGQVFDNVSTSPTYCTCRVQIG